VITAQEDPRELQFQRDVYADGIAQDHAERENDFQNRLFAHAIDCECSDCAALVEECRQRNNTPPSSTEDGK